MQWSHAKLVTDVRVGTVIQKYLGHVVFVLESGDVQGRGVRVLEVVVSTTFEPLLYLLHNKISDFVRQA